MRIAQTNTNLRIAILALLTVTWASFFITFIGTFLYCRPVSAIWTPQLVIEGKGICAPVSTLVIIGHVATVSTILTDMGLVLVPAIMLWNTQMKKQQKLQAFGLLSFASVASVITMVRIPYINKFEKGEDLPCMYCPPRFGRYTLRMFLLTRGYGSLGSAHDPLLECRNGNRLYRLVRPFLAAFLPPHVLPQRQ
jgi:hypothetical protein